MVEVATQRRFGLAWIRYSLGPMAVIAVAFTVACGGGGSRPAPSPTPGPSPTPTPQPAEWSVTGQIVEYGTGALVGGAQLVPGIAASATVDPSGIFRIVGTATPAMFRARIEAPGYLPRETYIRAEAAARNGLAINLIPNRAPFSLNFYRELVRDAAEAPLQPLARLTRNPSIYLRTVDQNGRAIEPEVLDSVSRSVRKAVVDWSSGTLSVAAFERGSATRPRTMGWIMINIPAIASLRFADGRSWGDPTARSSSSTTGAPAGAPR
jgi:hypothetical protein